VLTWTGAVGRTSVISLPGINNEIACQRVREENHVLPMRRVHSERLGRTKQQWVRVQGSSTCQVLDGPPRLFGAPGHVLGEARRGTLILCRDLEGVNHKASAPRVPRALRHVACGNNSRVHHCAPKHVPAPAQSPTESASREQIAMLHFVPYSDFQPVPAACAFALNSTTVISTRHSGSLLMDRPDLASAVRCSIWASISSDLLYCMRIEQSESSNTKCDVHR
jgi:hypothetical protein